MSSILDLNGEWDVVFDTMNSGIDNRWYANKPEGTQKATVPHTWEQEFGRYSGSICFYYKTFEISGEPHPKRVFLRFQRSFFHTMVWVNGKLVGTSQGGHNPFSFNIAKYLRQGENTICLRVASESAGRIQGVPVQELPVGLPFHQRSFGGLWGDVELVNGGKACILETHVMPDLDTGNVQLSIQFSNPRNYSTKLLIAVTRPDGTNSHFVKEIKLEKEDTLYKTTLHIKEHLAWSVEQPALYALEILLDRSFPVSLKFGFRKFDIIRGEYYLNDTLLRLQGVVYNLSHPVTGGIISSIDEVKNDLLRIKEAGFTILRSGGAPMEDRVLDLCDEIGLMVWQEMPIHNMRTSAEGFELAKEVIRSIVVSQRNHPSIVAWVLGAENGSLVLENGNKLLTHVSEVDETRPILSNINCVYLDNEDNFTTDTGKVMGVTHEKISLFNSHRVNPAMNFSNDLAAFFSSYWEEGSNPHDANDPTLASSHFFQDNYTQLLKANSNGRVLLNLSFHTTLPELEDVLKFYGKSKTLDNGKRLSLLSKEISDFVKSDEAKGVWKNEEDFVKDVNYISLRATRERVDTFLSSSQVNGYFLDCWADANPLFNGVVDEFRRPKVELSSLRKLNLPTRLLITGIERIVATGSVVNYKARFLNGDRITDGRFEVELLDAKGKKLKSETHRFEPKGALFPLPTLAIKAPSKAGSFTLRYSLYGERNALLHQTSKELLVISAPKEKELQSRFSFFDEMNDKERSAELKGKKILVSRYPSRWSGEFSQELIGAVKKGATLLVNALNPYEAAALNAAEILPGKVKLHISTGAKTSAWHYWKKGPLFAGLEGWRIGNIAMGDLLPLYSFDLIKEGKVEAGCATIDENGEFNSWGDIATFKVGKGKVILHQYRLLERLSSSAAAAMLLNNIG